MPGQCALVKALVEKVLKKLVRLYLRLFHRIKITGLENVPGQFDRLLIICNHASFLDAVILWTYLKPNLKILVDLGIARQWFMKLFPVNAHTLPIDSLNPYALKEAIQFVEQGWPLLIFPEGRISTTGGFMKIYEGAGLITFKTKAQILPIYLDTYQTVFSRRRGRKRLFAPISMTIGKLQAPLELDYLPPKERKKEAARRIYGVFGELFYATHHKPTTLGREFIRLARQNKRKIAFKDVTRREISYSQALLSAGILGKYLAKYPDRTLGLLLPNLAVTALLFMGLQLAGKVAAFLNYAGGVKTLQQAMHLADIRVVITSRQFLERIKIGAEIFQGKTVVYLEDLEKEIGWRRKIQGWLTMFRPGSFFAGHKIKPSEIAVILFTSGSEGVPKGVGLTHENIIANIYQCLARLDVRENDFLLNPLPMFHSFGLTVGTLLPLFANAGVLLYINPLHYRIVPETAYEQNCTMLIATNTFLRGFGKRAHPYDFYSMRYIFCGAEALHPAVFETYAKVYGIRVLTGYGATECAPVLTMSNALENRSGTVGKFLPGIEYKILPVAGLAPRNGRVGQLYVKGRNVMPGYLNNAKANHKYLVEDQGWYDTGDVVEMTDDGFLIIRDRLKRFAKISGEMVSLTSVEEALTAGLTGRKEIAVLSLPDEVKGEKIVAVTNLPDLQLASVRATLKSQGFSSLVYPEKIMQMKEIPKLGTGKTDYVQLREMISAGPRGPGPDWGCG